jgi:hypothetical protein
MERIYYSRIGGYKYRLEEDYEIRLPVEFFLWNMEPIILAYIELGRSGRLRIKKGYAWDGPSGPTVDTPDFMRGALVHDCLYQLMRLGYYRGESCRKAADKMLYKICIEDGMPRWRANYVYWAVRLFAGKDARPKQKEELDVLVAPEDK